MHGTGLPAFMVKISTLFFLLQDNILPVPVVFIKNKIRSSQLLSRKRGDGNIDSFIQLVTETKGEHLLLCMMTETKV